MTDRASDKFDQLRRQAEELLHNQPNPVSETPADILDLIQELKVHQMELQIQNEELKRTQEELSELHREYENLYEFAPCAYLTINGKGIITRINLTGVRLLGNPKTLVMHSGFGRFLEPAWEDIYLAARKSSAETKKKQTVELPVKTENGSPLWVRAEIEAQLGDSDEVVQWRMVLVDITEQKAADKALSKSEEKFSKLFFSSPTWLAFTRVEDGEYLEVNEAFEKITGFTREETIGRNSLELGLWGDTERREHLIKIARKKGGFREQAVTFLTKDGRSLPALWSAVVVEMDGEDCLLSTVMDISELKRAEDEKKALITELQQAHKMEAIGTLAGGIAHEFNNALGIILGNAELAMDDVPDWNPAKECLKEITTASFRAKEVVRQILSFARKTMTALKPLEINTIVKESLKLMRASIPAMIDIQQNISSEPKMILGDPTEIHQIVINLCTNAAHAMKENGGILEVSISELSLNEKGVSRYEDLSPGDFVRLTVKDSGEGMTPDILERVFEPYFTTKEFGAGSGMGLAVVYGLLKKCKGAINIESAVGKGSTVEVLFPKIEDEPPSKEEEREELPKGNERILLVDDDPSIAKMIRRMLERFGYTATDMTDSTATLELFKSGPDDFDLVITDMAMPNMSGDQLAAELIKVKKDIPIILCTGHSDTIDEEKAKRIGIEGFAMKPLDMGKLARAVRAVLDG